MILESNYKYDMIWKKNSLSFVEVNLFIDVY